MANSPLSPDGPATDKEWENAVKGWLVALGIGVVQRNEPPFFYRGNRWTPVKGGGGWPDFSVHTAVGQPSHWVECKKTCEDRVPLGGDDTAGVSDRQAECMDALEALGHRCWIALRWEPPEQVRVKSRQGALDGSRVELGYSVQRIIPWAAWGPLRATAVAARARGGKVEASIPAEELATLGHPLRDAGELRRAFIGGAS